MYVGVHLFYLGGIGGRRITVVINAVASLFGARQSRIVLGEPSTKDRSAPAEAARS
jgi:hypothetical protein